MTSQGKSSGIEKTEDVWSDVYLMFPHCVDFQEKSRSSSRQYKYKPERGCVSNTAEVSVLDMSAFLSSPASKQVLL